MIRQVFSLSRVSWNETILTGWGIRFASCPGWSELKCSGCNSRLSWHSDGPHPGSSARRLQFSVGGRRVCLVPVPNAATPRTLYMMSLSSSISYMVPGDTPQSGFPKVSQDSSPVTSQPMEENVLAVNHASFLQDRTMTDLED